MLRLQFQMDNRLSADIVTLLIYIQMNVFKYELATDDLSGLTAN